MKKEEKIKKKKIKKSEKTAGVEKRRREKKREEKKGTLVKDKKSFQAREPRADLTGGKAYAEFRGIAFPRRVVKRNVQLSLSFFLLKTVRSCAGTYFLA